MDDAITTLPGVFPQGISQFRYLELPYLEVLRGQNFRNKEHTIVFSKFADHGKGGQDCSKTLSDIKNILNILERRKAEKNDAYKEAFESLCSISECDIKLLENPLEALVQADREIVSYGYYPRTNSIYINPVIAYLFYEALDTEHKERASRGIKAAVGSCLKIAEIFYHSYYGTGISSADKQIIHFSADLEQLRYDYDLEQNTNRKNELHQKFNLLENQAFELKAERTASKDLLVNNNEIFTSFLLMTQYTLDRRIPPFEKIEKMPGNGLLGTKDLQLVYKTTEFLMEKYKEKFSLSILQILNSSFENGISPLDSIKKISLSMQKTNGSQKSH